MTTDFRPLVLLAAIFAAFGLQTAIGCVRQGGQLDFTPTAATAIEDGIAVLCPMETSIPDVGAEIAMTCALQVGALDKLIASRTADGGTPPTVTVKLRRKALATADGGAR